VAPKALILDFDGVMTDTDIAGERVWRALFGWYGSIAAVELFDRHCREWTLPELHEALASIATRPIEPDAFDKEWGLVWSTFAWNGLPARADALDLLRAAKRAGWQTAIATNAQAWYVQRHLQLWDVGEHVDAIRAVSGTTMAKKPAPDVYLSAAAALAVEPTDAVAVEDSDDGLHAAVSAGMIGIGLRTRHRRDSFDGATTVVDDFRDLASILGLALG
jgi:putative hydrolase of the HAD superfamily